MGEEVVGVVKSCSDFSISGGLMEENCSDDDDPVVAGYNPEDSAELVSGELLYSVWGGVGGGMYPGTAPVAAEWSCHGLEMLSSTDVL